MWKDSKGITIVALVITIVIMLILVGVVIYEGSDIVKQSNLEDIRTNMITIQGKARIIAEKYSFSESEELVGLKIEKSGSTYQAQDGYNISNLQTVLLNDDSTEVGKEANYYIWTQDNLNDNGLSSIKINKDEFYIVNYTNCEIFYSARI